MLDIKFIRENEQEARKFMKEVVNKFFEGLNNRDMGSLNFKGYIIYLSGGLSYGDNPTDSYDTINKFNLLPTKILSAGGIE